jgi:hypothetical protein
MKDLNARRGFLRGFAKARLRRSGMKATATSHWMSSPCLPPPPQLPLLPPPPTPQLCRLSSPMQTCGTGRSWQGVINSDITTNHLYERQGVSTCMTKEGISINLSPPHYARLYGHVSRRCPRHMCTSNLGSRACSDPPVRLAWSPCARSSTWGKS